MSISGSIAEELKSSIGQSNYEKLKTITPKKFGQYFSNHHEFKKFKEEFENALKIQVCFIIDVTGSMANHSSFKNNIFGLIMDTLFEFMNKRSQKRYAFIGYRERDEKNIALDFTDDVEKMRKIINDVELKGGGDGPEDVEHAFKLFCEEINFNQGGTRIIIHIADAPCHGREYNDYKDDHPDWSNNIPKLLKRMVCNQNCAYWFIKINESTDKMIQKFNKILKEAAPDSDLNEIVQMDLRNLKNDMIKKVLEESFLKTTMLSTKLSLEK